MKRQKKVWKPRSAVLLHTYDFREPNWISAMWGTPEEPGRIPTAVAAALESGAELFVVFEDVIVVTDDGKKEGEVICEFLFKHINELPAFAPALPIFKNIPSEEISRTMKKILFLSSRTIVNTRDEIATMFSIAMERGIEMVIFVTNFDHMPRVVQLVGTVWRDKGRVFPTPLFRAAASLYSGKQYRMEDIVVFEPSALAALNPVHPRRLLALRDNKKILSRIDAILTSVGA